MPLTGVQLPEVHLTGVHITGVHLTGVHLLQVYSVYLLQADATCGGVDFDLRFPVGY